MRGHKKGAKKYRSMPRSIDVEPEIRFAGTKVMLTCVQVLQRGHNVTREGGLGSPEPYFTEEFCMSIMARIWQMERDNVAEKVLDGRFETLHGTC